MNIIGIASFCSWSNLKWHIWPWNSFPKSHFNYAGKNYLVAWPSNVFCFCKRPKNIPADFFRITMNINCFHLKTSSCEKLTKTWLAFSWLVIFAYVININILLMQYMLTAGKPLWRKCYEMFLEEFMFLKITLLIHWSFTLTFQKDFPK